MSNTLEFKWTVSRGRNTYGYNICSLYVDGRKVSACNGGGYDMKGTALGDFIARRYADRLRKLQPTQKFYGLSYHDPNYDPGKAVVGSECTDRTLGQNSTGKTVEEAEAAGESLGLERYQAFYKASSHIPTEQHTVPLIDGACGFSSVEKIMQALGLSLEGLNTRSRRRDMYLLHDNQAQAA